MKKEIYLDNAATTKVDEEVIKEMLPYFNKNFGNASSQHSVGTKAKLALENSRKIIAESINSKPHEIIFTSGGTEGNNFILKGIFFENKKSNPTKNHLITTKIEHESILKVCKWLETQGAKLTYLDVNEEGFINLEQLKKSITKETLLVSIIHGNNEIGTIQNIEEIGKICKEKKVLFHIDACQSFTKTKINTKTQDIDLITLNSHKIYGPKGIGAVYIKEGIKITPLLHGGGHEKKLRSGTENIPAIVGFAKAVSLSNEKDIKRMEKLRDKIIDGLLKIENVKLNGPVGEKRLCNNINVSFNNIEGEALGGYLENYGIFTSTGSACMSNTLETSHVLKAIGLSPLQSNSSLRISISKYTTEKEADYFLEKLKIAVNKLRGFSPIIN